MAMKRMKTALREKPSTGTERAKPAVVSDKSIRGGGVQSIERCFAILTEIAKYPDGINLADLSKALGLHTSTAFHLVRTLVDIRAVRQDRVTKRYQLGRTIFAIAANSLTEIQLVSAARPLLEKLSETTGESSHLALPWGSNVVIALRLAGTGSVQLVDRTGGLRPSHCTSIGKIMLAEMSPHQFENFLSTEELKPWTVKTITDPERLRQEIAEVRARGIAYDDAEFDDEARCVAAPVRDFSGQVIAALGISGPIWRMSLPRLQEIARLVSETAAELSSELGYSGKDSA
jgi:DNA-binding IclR family transcriptional regulator